MHRVLAIVQWYFQSNINDQNSTVKAPFFYYYYTVLRPFQDYFSSYETKRTKYGVEAETRKSQASFQLIQVSAKAET